MSSKKCQNCGCTEIDTDPARGDAVCTNCGSVLEDNIIVSEVQFEENAHGGSSSIGQFVSSDSKGGGGFAGGFHSGLGKESREITLRLARKGIVELAQQLRLNQHCIDTASNFFKMALNRNLTRGRKHMHVLAACVYMTCRTEGTPHMLIDFSDVLQICVYELGRTYLRLSQALCINIPAMDPCIYVLRFANRLEFEEKTHEVSLTAIRLLQRMKRDWLHTGRRPSGLCGAALLIAARLHDFSRTPMDIIKIVKIHESTLRKRLFEFGETPSSSLTLNEFMTVDLEEEQDPPAFKAARKRDRERLQKLIDEEDVDDKVIQLQKEIDKHIEERRSRTPAKTKKKRAASEELEEESDQPECVKEKEDTKRFIVQSTLGTIQKCLINRENSNEDEDNAHALNISANTMKTSLPKGLGPTIAIMGLEDRLNENDNSKRNDGETEHREPGEEREDEGELDLEGIDDEEIESYIVSEKEASSKEDIWMKINAEYLKEQQEKEERLAKEREGKPEKKKRKVTRKPRNNYLANSAGEAIEKMLQEKKISSKINYDVLRSLTDMPLAVKASPESTDVTENTSQVVQEKCETPISFGSVAEQKSSTTGRLKSVRFARKPMKSEPHLKPERVIKHDTSPADVDKIELKRSDSPVERESRDKEPELILPDYPDDVEELEEEEEDEHDHNEMSVAQLLSQHRGEDDEYYNEYDDDDYA